MEKWRSWIINYLILSLTLLLIIWRCCCCFFKNIFCVCVCGGVLVGFKLCFITGLELSDFGALSVFFWWSKPAWNEKRKDINYDTVKREEEGWKLTVLLVYLDQRFKALLGSCQTILTLKWWREGEKSCAY